MHPISSRILLTAGLVAANIPSACSTRRAHMRTAIVELTGEAREISVFPSPHSPVAVASHRQMLSIGGLINLPDVGQQVQFPGRDDVTTAVGIAVAQSYRIVGETELPTEAAAGPDGELKLSAVGQVRDALERVQALALEASLLTSEIHSMPFDDPLRESLLEDRTRRRAQVEADLGQAQADLRRAANRPGIVVARWNAGEEAGAGWSWFSTAGEWREARSGFVVLGGLRVVSLVLGEDFWWLLNNLRPHEKSYIDQIGMTTSLIQVRELAYTSDLLTRQGLALQARLADLDSGQLAAARVGAYWSFVGQYTNSGNLPRIEWKREPFCAVCSLDLPELARAPDRALQACFGVDQASWDASTLQGWRTISATVTFLRDVPGFLRWKDVAEEYAKQRKMWPAPACPKCGGNEQPAAIHGWNTTTEGG